MPIRLQLYRREHPQPDCPVKRLPRKIAKTVLNRQSCWQKLDHSRGLCLTLRTISWTGLTIAARKSRLRISDSKLRRIALHKRF